MAPGQQPPTSRGRILVVDDDLGIRTLLTEFLEQEQFEVCPVSDGSAALKRFHAEHFDMIFVDFRMPGMTGLDFAIEVRKSNPHIPIALITGTIKTLDDKAIVEAGITRAFPKPFDFNELAAWIRSQGF